MLDRALITGGSGMVGSYIEFGLKPSSTEMDVCDRRSVERFAAKNFGEEGPSCIIHLAATNLRESQDNVKKAIDVNVNGTTNMVFLAKKYGIPFVFLSTGAVFSSDNAGVRFEPNFETSPNCVYGYTKAAGEKIAALYERSITIRTGWLFGGHQKTHYKFVENTMTNLATNGVVKASSDFVGSPTYVKDLIQYMVFFLKNSEYGIKHVVNSGVGTGVDIAREIARNMGIDEDSRIVSVKHRDLPNAGPQRSATEVLEGGSNHLRPWREALAEYCAEAGPKSPSQSHVSLKIQAADKWTRRSCCRLCSCRDLHVFFELEPTPPANHFVKSVAETQESIPLDIAMCSKCMHIQLMQIVDPAFLYSHYLYVSSTSQTMTRHLKDSVTDFTREFAIRGDDAILEIGANDGVCVRHLIEQGFSRIIGVDPAQNIKDRHDLPIICDFFGTKMVETLRSLSAQKHYRLIYAFHCCAHIEDINDVFSAVHQLLDERDGVFIMEVGYFLDVFRNHCFDTIYHEHIDYHTCRAMRQFAHKHHMVLFRVKTNTIQGGSIQFFFSHAETSSQKVEASIEESLRAESELAIHNIGNLLNWKRKIVQCGKDMNYILNSLKSCGKRIAGYGASAKSTTFMHQYRISGNVIDYIIDDNVFKHNYYSPGIHIPIRSMEFLSIEHPEYIIILSWNFTEEIVKKLENYREMGGRIIVPFPEIRFF